MLVIRVLFQGHGNRKPLAKMASLLDNDVFYGENHRSSCG
uniref:Uncharacterized protein n=1 Tax=Rhizobium rhizogenes TaxID=359 RepID=A0A7S5DRC9_RHIRH|nr:hypothetical protein pC5.7b_290 [Rhizobium rhizogenes]QCL09371.1 hypothetical protein pC5.7c_504 [Rhizobium rhizogenes]QCL09541.1 hypothetical protein pC5.8a_49 [Rhizobium rhizogenes]QCL09793.1 hypothetical protein pC5.8b_303 [Rhizobium rhizogenes]